MTRVAERADRVGYVSRGIEILVLQAMGRVRIRVDTGNYVGPVIAAAGQRVVLPGGGIDRQAACVADQRRDAPVAQNMGKDATVPESADVHDTQGEEMRHHVR